MADQISNFKPKRQVLQLKPLRLCLQTLMVGLCVLALSICSVQTATCPSSVLYSAAMTTEQCNFTEYTSTEMFGIAMGPVSNSLYYLYRLNSVPSTSYSAAIRRVDASGSQTWMASFTLDPIMKSLSVDAAEQSVYLATSTVPLEVLKLSTSNGSKVSHHKFTGISGGNNDIKTWPLADLSGYFVIGYDDSTHLAKICKYTFSSSNAQCQLINNIYYGYGQLMISNSQFFIFGADATSPYNLHMYKITFSLTSLNWADQIVCTSVACSIINSESVLSSDVSTIYSFFTFAVSSTYYLYFCGLSVSDGSVRTTRYKSSTSALIVWGSALNGDYVVATTQSPVSVVMYSISSSTFTIKTFSGSNLYWCGVEPSSGRFVVGGRMGSNGYTTKFVPQSISSNSDFSSSSWSMTALSAGTDDIVVQSGVIFAAPDAYFIPDVGTNVNQTATYNLISSVTSDAYIQTTTQSLYVSESTTSMQTPNLSCSSSGSTSIAYSLSSYNSAIIPSFVSINSTTGVLTIAAPSVSSSTTYSFYITSTVSGMSGPVQKIINLTIKKCTVNNCQICTVTDSSVCTTCNSLFSLSTGSCNLPETAKSEVAKLLSTSNQVFFGTIALISVGLSFTNLSSMASLWSVINQMQILFLLFLTGAFIPQDIEDIITGLSICLNPFIFLQLKLNWDHNFVSSYFDFGLKNSNLEKFGIKSDSTIVNLASFLLSIIIILILHLCIFLVQKLLPKESKSNCCNYVLSGIHWILQKLMILFTFALYIRVILQTNQFILISCVSEIYQFNFYGTKRIISTIIALFVFIACIAIIAITIILTCSNDAYKLYESPDERSKFEQLFSEVSLNKKSRIFVCLLQIRRAVFVILLITIGPEFSIIAISILVGLQLIYFILLVVIRPYKEVNCNAIEIINELYFLVIIASLLKYNTADDWEGTPTTAYTWFISSNSFISLLVYLADGVKKIAIKCRNKYCKNNSESIRDNSVQPIVASRIDHSANNAKQSNVQMNKRNPSVNIQFESRITKHRIGNKVYVKR